MSHRIRNSPKNRVDVDFPEGAGLHATRSRTFKDGEKQPYGVKRATWKKIKGVSVATRLSDEVKSRAKDFRYRKTVIDFQTFDVNPKIDPATFTSDALYLGWKSKTDADVASPAK